MTVHRCLRFLGAALVLVGGGIHFDLWEAGYRAIPSIGPLFVVNAVASVVLAVALGVTGRPAVLLVGALFVVGSLAALVASRTVGLLGFSEMWTDQSFEVLAAEIGAMVALFGAAVARPRARRRPALAYVDDRGRRAR